MRQGRPRRLFNFLCDEAYSSRNRKPDNRTHWSQRPDPIPMRNRRPALLFSYRTWQARPATARHRLAVKSHVTDSREEMNTDNLGQPDLEFLGLKL